MSEMFFPSRYKKSLLNKTKNTTIRVKAEIGKYKAGKIYSAKSYAGKDWGIKVKILRVFLTILGELSKFRIPRQSVEVMQRKEKLSLDEKVELIEFKVL